MDQEHVIQVRWGVDEEPVYLLMRKEDKVKTYKEFLIDHEHQNGIKCECPKDIENRTIYSVVCIEMPCVLRIQFYPDGKYQFVLHRREDKHRTMEEILTDHVHINGKKCECPKSLDFEKMKIRVSLLEANGVLPIRKIKPVKIYNRKRRYRRYNSYKRRLRPTFIMKGTDGGRKKRKDKGDIIVNVPLPDGIGKILFTEKNSFLLFKEE